MFTNGRNFITQDVTSHNGGTWKMARSVKALGSKATRDGTFDPFLNPIGEQALTCDDPNHYWSVDIVGLTEEMAIRVKVLVEDELARSCSLVDPRHFFTMHADRETVRMLRDGLTGDDAAQNLR